MNDDQVLRDRLANLAAAVPVRPSSPMAMVRRPVRLGPAFRPASGRSWVLVALVATLLVAAVGILGSGSQPAYGPVVETVRQGDFELTIRSAKGLYAPGEPINIEASLTYRGTEAEAHVIHAGGAASSPINFLIREPIFGATLDGIWEASRNRTSLTRGVALDVPFAKSGGWQSPPPEEFQTWLAEPGLQLPSGTWHVAAIAEFSVDDVQEFKLEAEIAITVESPTPSPTDPPAPTERANPEQSTTVRDGDFELTLRSDKTYYLPDEPIDVTGTLTYLGTEDIVTVNHSSTGLVRFGVREPIFGVVELTTRYDLADCGKRTDIERGAPVEQPFGKTGIFPSDHPEAEAFRAFMKDPVLRLPTGTWHIYAKAGFGPVCGGSSPAASLEAEITIEVEAVVPAPTEIANPTQSATARDGDFELTLRSDKTHYAPNVPIDVSATLTYHGGSQTVEITHDSGGPILFGIREKVFGAIQVGGISRLVCGSTTMSRDDPIVKRFRKSGSFSNEHPDADMHQAWIADPELRLPEGTWHLYAASSGPCLGGGPTYNLMAEIEIVVDDDPAATPGHPTPTEWADKPVYGGADIGWVVLQLKSTHARYEAGEPVELEASYWFADGKPLVASHFYPEVALSIEQLDAIDPQTRTIIYDSDCVDLGMVEGAERLLVLGPGNVTSMSADLLPPDFEDLFVDGTLRLPVGRWRISASVEGTFAACGERGDPYALATAVEIEVVEHLP